MDNEMRETAAPAEPMTPAAESWAAMHEWYTGMRQAGFSLNEAATIIAAVLRHQPPEN